MPECFPGGSTSGPKKPAKRRLPPTLSFVSPTREALEEALNDGATLSLLLLLVGKDNIDVKQKHLKKLEDQLKTIQDKIKSINTENSRIQVWIQEHSKKDKWKKKTEGVRYRSTLKDMQKYGGYSWGQLEEMQNGDGQAQNMSNALTNTAKALDQEAQRLTTKASQATQEFNSFVDIISSAMKSNIDAVKKTVNSF